MIKIFHLARGGVLLAKDEMTTRRPAWWLRPLSECIGNNFIAKIQVPSLPEQQLPRMNTVYTHPQAAVLPSHTPLCP